MKLQNSSWWPGLRPEWFFVTFLPEQNSAIPEITLATKPIILSTNSAQISAEQSFYTTHKKAKVIIDNKFGVSKLIVDINGHEQLFEMPKDIFGYKRNVEIDISKHIKVGRNTVKFRSPDLETSAFNKGVRLYVELIEKNVNEWE